MIVYKLSYKPFNQEPTEKLFTKDAVDNGKLREELGRIFGWSGYASSVEEEDDAMEDLRFQRAFETALLALANSKAPGTLEHKERWASLTLVEVV